MSAEEAKENNNPLSAFKDLFVSARKGVLSTLGVSDTGIPCGAYNKESNDNQRMLLATRDGR